jgi:hypothetical protein
MGQPLEPKWLTHPTIAEEDSCPSQRLNQSTNPGEDSRRRDPGRLVTQFSTQNFPLMDSSLVNQVLDCE